MSRINLDYFFTNLGITGGNLAATNQADFYSGITWADGSTTYNQFEFFEKLGMSRYDFFTLWANNEFEFYSNIQDNLIYDFFTYYNRAGIYLGFPDWILKTGYWDDLFAWLDSETWND